MTATSPETIFGRYFLSEHQPWIMDVSMIYEGDIPDKRGTGIWNPLGADDIQGRQS